MDYYTTKTMVGNNNWQGRRTTIDDSCQPAGYKHTSGSFAFARFLILTMLMMTLGVTGAWGQETYTWKSGDQTATNQVKSGATSIKWSAYGDNYDNSGIHFSATRPTPGNAITVAGYSGQGILFDPYKTGTITVTFYSNDGSASATRGARVLLVNTGETIAEKLNCPKSSEYTIEFDAKAGQRYLLYSAGSNEFYYRKFSFTPKYTEDREWNFSKMQINGTSVTSFGTISITGALARSAIRGMGSFADFAWFGDWDLRTNNGPSFYNYNGTGSREFAVLNLQKGDRVRTIYYANTASDSKDLLKGTSGLSSSADVVTEGTNYSKLFTITETKASADDNHLAMYSSRQSSLYYFSVIRFYYTEKSTTVKAGESVSPKMEDGATPKRAASASYASANTSVATVDGSGRITGVAAGTTTITATSDDGLETSITVTVTPDERPAPSLRFNNPAASIEVGSAEGSYRNVAESCDGLTVTYSIESDPNNLVQSINPTTGEVTFKKALYGEANATLGTVRVKASTAATSEFKAGSAYYDIVVKKTGWYFSDASYWTTVAGDLGTSQNPWDINDFAEYGSSYRHRVTGTGLTVNAKDPNPLPEMKGLTIDNGHAAMAFGMQLQSKMIVNFGSNGRGYINIPAQVGQTVTVNAGSVDGKRTMTTSGVKQGSSNDPTTSALAVGGVNNVYTATATTVKIGSGSSNSGLGIHVNSITLSTPTRTVGHLNYNTTTLGVGGSHATLSGYTITVENGTGDFRAYYANNGKPTTFASSNTDVITVNPTTGEITPVGAGTAFVTATTTNAPTSSVEYQAVTFVSECITVSENADPVISFAEDEKSASIHELTTASPVLSTLNLTGTVVYSIVSGGTGSASINNSDGTVTMIKPGTVTVKARSEDDDMEDTYTLTILDTQKFTYTTTGDTYTVTGLGYVDNHTTPTINGVTMTIGKDGESVVVATLGSGENNYGFRGIRSNGKTGTNTSNTPPADGTFYKFDVSTADISDVRPLILTVTGRTNGANDSRNLQLLKADGTVQAEEALASGDNNKEISRAYRITETGTYYLRFENGDYPFSLRQFKVVAQSMTFAQEEHTAYLEDLTFAYAATVEGGATPTYTVESGDAAVVGDPATGALRLVQPGTVTIKASASNLTDVTYTLTVTTRNTITASALVSGDSQEQTFNAGSTVGQLVGESVTLNGITLNFGANTTDNSKNELQVVRKVRDVKNNNGTVIGAQYGVTGIDIKGYTHGTVNAANDQWGTYYKVTIPAGISTGKRHITIKGYFDNNTADAIVKNSSYANIATIANTDEAECTVEYEWGPGTYYIYSPSAAFCLSSMRVELPRQTLSFATPQVYKVMDDLSVAEHTFDVQSANNASTGGGAISYSSADAAIASVDGTNVTLRSSGVVNIIATAAAVKDKWSETTTSYTLNVNIKENWNSVDHPQKWVFAPTLGGTWPSTATTTGKTGTDIDLVPETNGLKFTNNTNGRLEAVPSEGWIKMNVDAEMKIPSLTKGQIVVLVVRGRTSVTADITNGKDIDNDFAEDPTKVSIPSSGSTLRYQVANDGNFIFKSNTNDLRLQAIYVYTPIHTKAAMSYNGGLDMQVGGTARPHDVGTFLDKWDRPLSATLFGEVSGYASSDAAKVEVTDAALGTIEAKATTGATITASVLSLDPMNYLDAAISTPVVVESSTDKKSHTIAVTDLLYLPMKTSIANGLDRTIPRFTLTMTGGNSLMSNNDGTRLVINGGNIRVGTRLKNAGGTKVNFTNAVLYYVDGTAEAVNNINAETLDIMRREKEITHLMLEYQSVGASTTNPDDLLDQSKLAPTLNYSPSSYTLKQGTSIEVFRPTASAPFLNFSGITYSLSSGGKVTLADHTLTAVATSGSETLTASFSGSTYFAGAASSVTCTINCSDAVYAMTFDITTIDVPSTPKIQGFVIGGEELHTTVTVISGEGASAETVAPSKYDVTYSVSDPALAYINANGKVSTQAYVDGLVTVTAIATPKDSSKPILTADYQLQVVSGFWDFRKFTQDVFNNQLQNGGSSPNDDNWSQNNNARLRDSKEMEPVVITATTNQGEPLSMTMALETQYKVRFQYTTSAPRYGNLHLFGLGSNAQNKAKYGYGGVLKVPVRKGMVIEINGWTDNSSHSEMLINTTGRKSDDEDTGDYAGVTDLNGNKVVKYYVDETAESQRFIVTTDGGFLYIVNPSSNLDFHISYIRLTNDILFKYGTETYVQKEESNYTFINPIINATDHDTFEYAHEVLSGGELVQSVNTSDGVATLKGSYDGHYRVYATGTGTAEDALLAGASNSYVAHVINLVLDNSNTEVALGELTFDADYLKALIKDGGDGTKWNASDPISISDIRNAAVFSVNDDTDVASAVLTGTAPNQTLTVNGIGKLKLNVTVGAIEKTVEITINGADFDDRAPVVPLAQKSYTFTLKGAPQNVRIDTEQIHKDILGDLAADCSNIEINWNEGDKTITVNRTSGAAFGKGGAIPITVTYDFDANGNGTLDDSEKGHTMTAVLTVAYTEHKWTFDGHNLLSYDRTKYGGTEGSQYDGLKDFYTAVSGSTKTRTGTWTSSATFDQPGEAGTHSADNQWRFIRKIVNHPEAALIYYYSHSVRGDNATVVPESAGLHFFSDKGDRQLAVEMQSPTGTNPRVEQLLDGNYDLRSIMLRSGGKLVIPQVQPGQWIEMRWYRHNPDMGERLSLTNLCDINGTPITQVYKIMRTGQTTDSYMLQVDPSLKAGDDGVTEFDGKLYVDASITVVDNIYVDLREVILHEPGWDYNSSMNSNVIYERLPDLGGDGEQKTDKDGNLLWTYNNAVPLNLLAGLTGRTINFSTSLYQNAPTARSEWEIVVVGNLKGAGVTGNAATNEDDPSKARPEGALADDGEVRLTWSSGWGKAYITLNSYTTNYKYVANRRTWILTIGEPPRQDYPHTWDFTKYFSNTKTQVGKVDRDDYEQEDPNYNKESNRYGAHEYRQLIDSWKENGALETVITKDYNTSVYNSYFVNGAQLVTYGLKDDETYAGRLPETDGLGIWLKNLDDADNANDGTLTLDMQNTNEDKVRATQVGTGWQTWETTGALKIKDGHIIVPKPGSKTPLASGDNATNYYIYVRSNTEPAVVNSSADVLDAGAAVPNVYEYRFAGDADAEFSFSGDAEVYQIAVTNIQKQMKPLSGTAWATESREPAIDYTLDSLLTVNPVGAYVVQANSGNPTYSDDKAKTVVAIKDRRYVVPEQTGLVLKQTERYDGSDYAGIATDATATYDVPLFVPAVTTACDPEYLFRRNLMKPTPVDEKTGKPVRFEYERANADGEDDEDGAFTRFILAYKYMTWKKQGDESVTTDGKWNEDRRVAAFYRLHVFGSGDTAAYGTGETGETGDTDTAAYETENTLGRNKAYLLLLTDKINDPIWSEPSSGSPSSAPSRDYVGIAGISDMDEGQQVTGERTGDGRTYNLQGQVVDGDGALPSGIYIRNGRKIIVK